MNNRKNITRLQSIWPYKKISQGVPFVQNTTWKGSTTTEAISSCDRNKKRSTKW
jgi:hypothetical protein